MITPTTPRRVLRLPLIGDLAGIAVELPAEPLTAVQWEFFLRVLNAWKPAIVADAPEPPLVPPCRCGHGAGNHVPEYGCHTCLDCTAYEPTTEGTTP